VRIASFRRDGAPCLGLVSDDGREVRPLDVPGGLLSLIELLAQGGEMPPAAAALPLERADLLAPFPNFRRNIWCVGRNYHAHAKELSSSVFKDAPAQAWPMVFTKVPECVVGPHDEVRVPGDVSDQIDYEAELAIVIGQGGRNIRRDDAMRHIFGYTIVNDVTARDVQVRHQQWDLGKSFDTFCPMGPWVVTADEMDAPTADMIFDIPSLIETVSRGITLYPGDVIATGTPAGVGMGMQPPRWLRAGDRVRIEIDGIGFIDNHFT
jgi:2-keto-4-pentenoate hydratase/2-oxohepta-3-ene-1,7-dioic acid hydratase in catechol pathway